MKAFLASESYIIVVDLLSCKVTQILSCGHTSFGWTHRLSMVEMSSKRNIIKILGSHESQGLQRTEYVNYNFRTWRGTTLKDMCKSVITSCFTYDVLLQQNLPKMLMRELEGLYLLRGKILTD